MGARRLLARILRALGGALAVVAIAGGGTAVAASQFVTIAGLAFAPSTVAVAVGETVTWTNNDTQIHTATADDGSWNAGNIAGGGGIGAVVFSVAGTFPYHCEVHPTMTGTVTVAAAAAPSVSVAGATMRPTDTAPFSGPGRDMGLGLLPPLAIAALAMVVAVAVMRRPPSSIMRAVVAAEAPAGVVARIPRSPAAPSATVRRHGDATLAPVVIGGVALVVAIALIGRRLTSRR
jgi:plastocyanin